MANIHVEVIVSGHLPVAWSAEFDGLEVTCLAEGASRLAGHLPDQAALYGVLMRLRDLGVPLISMRHLFDQPEGAHEKSRDMGSANNKSHIVMIEVRKEPD